MSAQPASSPEQADEIADDIRCLQCNYDLRGLSNAGNCPECGLPIIKSIWATLLSRRDGQWLARMQGGLALILINVIGNIALIPLEVFVHSLWLQGFLLFFCRPGLVLTGSVGVWLASSRQPEVHLPRPVAHWRIRCRLVLLGELLAKAFTVGLDVISPRMVDQHPELESVLTYAGIMTWGALLIYLGRVLQPFLPERLACRAIFVGYTLIIVYLILPAMTMLPIGLALGSNLFVQIWTLFMLIGWTTALLATCYATVLFYTLGKVFEGALQRLD